MERSDTPVAIRPIDWRSSLNTQILDFGPFSAIVAEGWDDLTSTLEQPNAPLTIGDAESGVGAMQFSPAMYKSGPLPSVTTEALFWLLDDFALTRGLTMAFERENYPGSNYLVGQSFRDGGDFIRVWYASNGKSFLLITYVCDWSRKDVEASQREMTVRSIRFNEPAPNVGTKWR